MRKKLKDNENYRLKGWEWMIFIGCSAFLIRILIASFYYNGFDLKPYNIPWALASENGVFNLYQTLDNLDYPPLFPFLLSAVSWGVRLGISSEMWQLEMLFIKLIPVLFDVGIVLLLFLMGQSVSKTLGFTLSVLWTFNISSIFNCSFWGQTDSILLFFILLTFWLLYQERPFLSAIFFALGCLSKLQMAYFAPILLLEFCAKYPLRQWSKALGVGILTGIAGWLPFMIGAGDPFLPFKIYFGGFDKYNYINVNAFNLYGIFDLNWVSDQLSLVGGHPAADGMMIGGFTYSNLSTFFAGMILLLVCVGYFVSAWYNQDIPVVLHALVFMNGIFILTNKMHERYQMPVLILTLLCFVFCQKKFFLWIYFILTGLTFWNQSAVLWKYNYKGVFETVFRGSQICGSLLNVAVFSVLIWYYSKTVFRDPFRALLERKMDRTKA